MHEENDSFPIHAHMSKDNNFSLRFLLLHPVVWFLVATITVICTATILWEQHHESLVDHGLYRISPENVHINEPPVWLQTPLRNSLAELTESGKSLLDTDMVPAAADFASRLPWVRTVNRIEKNASGLEMQLEYRQPIALVDPINAPAVPVDADGVVFDATLLQSSEQSRLETDLLRINMPWLDLNSALPWHTAADQRITAGARLAEYLGANAKTLGLFRVVTYDRPTRLETEQPQWEIWTPNRTRVFWGAAPGFETNRESSAAIKMAALEQFVDKFGRLEDFESRASLKIDVSTGTAVLVKAARIAELDQWSKKIK